MNNRSITMRGVESINRCVLCITGEDKEGVELTDTLYSDDGVEKETRYPICESCISECFRSLKSDVK